MEITLVLMPEDIHKPMERLKIGSRDTGKMQSYVGSNIEVIDCKRPPCSLRADAEAKSKEHWRTNRRATHFLWVHNSLFWSIEVIAGDCLLTGVSNENGDPTSVPDELIQLFFDTREYRVEFQTAGHGIWNQLPDRFTDYTAAYRFAAYLRRTKIPEAREVRVLPA